MRALARFAIVLVVGSAAAAPAPDRTVIGTTLAVNQHVIDTIAHATPDAPEAPAADADTGADIPAALLPAEDARKPAPYWIHGKLEGTTAKLVIRFRIHPVGPSTWNTFELAIPDGGVVTGAVVAGAGVSRRLALELAEPADAQFTKVSDAKPGPRRGWAVELVPSDQFKRGVNAVVAAPRAAVLTIDLEVDAPTCFHRDQRMVAIAAAWRPSVERGLKIVGDGCVPAAKGGWSADENPARAWLAWRAPTHEVGPQIATRTERLDVAHGSIAHLEVSLGTQLAEVPADLHTVFVVDVSRSVAAGELETEAAVIVSYLAHAPDTQVQVVLYARKPRALFPAWTTAKAASATIAHELATLTEQNGSNVDAGLVEAARWLGSNQGTRRVVLFSDDRLGDRVGGLEPEVLRAVLPAHTLVHVVAVDHAPELRGFAWNGPQVEQPAIVRDDEVAFAQLALASEGFSAHAEAVDGRADARVLVRPIALEKVAIADGAWKEGAAPGIARACPHERADRDLIKLDLAEGDSCEWFGEGKGELGAITVHGLLWNHVVERRLTPSHGDGLALARTLVGFQLEVEDDVMKEVSLAARAVDQAWSLIATWGGPDGYGDMGGSAELYGSICGCDDAGMNGGFGSSGSVRITGSSLEDQLAKATAACHADARVTIDLEFTLHEIVDVVVAAPTAALRDCVTEAVWNAPVYLAKPLEHSTAHVVI